MRRFHTLILAMTVAALVLALAPAALAEGNCCPDLGEGQLAELDHGRSAVNWRVFAEHARVRLTVSTPCGVFDRVYKQGEDPFFDIRELAPDDPNGSYTWQIRVDPIVDPAVAKALKEARLSGDDEIVKELRRKGLLPAGPFVQSGAFSVIDGAIVDPNQGGEKEGSTVSRVSSEDTAVEFSTDGNVRRVTAADQVIPDDLIVQGSLCVGFDCVNNETFNADTIRLKENNLRIHADDTSTIAGFPNQDWRLEFNSQNSGGGEYFRVIDATASRNIMTLEANAPSNSLVVDDAGRVGFGTANPVVELHVANGDTPTLRLEQTTGSGFAAQTWDVAGNETNFFVRDVSGGSTLPFRIFPGAASSTLVIDDTDNVGISTTAPAEKLHIRASDNPRVLIEDTTDNANDKPGFVLRSPAAASAGDWVFEVDNGGNFQIDFGPSPGPEILLSDSTATNSTVTINGDLMLNGMCTGCDAVFQPGFELESIEEHSTLMWQQSYLPAVGPTPEGQTHIDVFAKTTGILQELEKAHIYIDQLNQGLKTKDARISELERRLVALEQRLVVQAADGE